MPGCCYGHEFARQFVKRAPGSPRRCISRWDRCSAAHRANSVLITPSVPERKTLLDHDVRPRRHIHDIASRANVIRDSYQAYVSGMVLAYHISQSEIYGIPERHWTTSYGLLGDVLQVLDFCAELDPVARKFAQILSTHRENIWRSRCYSIDAAFNTRSGTNRTVPAISALLLATCPTDILPQQTSARIVEQLCSPYIDNDDESPQSQLFPDASHPRGHFTTAILNEEDGYFVGSHHPSWWTTQRSSQIYLQGATTMEIL